MRVFNKILGRIEVASGGATYSWSLPWVSIAFLQVQNLSLSLSSLYTKLIKINPLLPIFASYLPSSIFCASMTSAKVKSSRPRQTIILLQTSKMLKRHKITKVAGKSFWNSSPIKGTDWYELPTPSIRWKAVPSRWMMLRKLKQRGAASLVRKLAE